MFWVYVFGLHNLVARTITYEEAQRYHEGKWIKGKDIPTKAGK